MEDKKVGELWRWCQEESPEGGKDWIVDDMRGLIRKLVHERAWKIAISYFGTLPESEEVKSCCKAACRDFDIDPETFRAVVAEREE